MKSTMNLTAFMNVAVLLILVTLSSHAFAYGFDASLRERIGLLANQTQFSGLMAARGASLQESDILASLGFGYSDVRGNIPNDPNRTRYPIASNSKVMTVILIFQLQELGLLNIHDNVANYLTSADFQEWGLPASTKFCFSLPGDKSKACQTITIEMLMGMTSGLTGPTQMVLLSYTPMLVNIAINLGLQFPMLTLSFKPGTQYNYCNQNFMILGYLIQKLTGLELGAAYKKFIFDPLGMKDSYFDRLDGLFTYDRLRTQEGFRYFMYDESSETVGAPLGVGKCEIDANTGTAQGAGGVVSTLKDEAILYYCLFDMSYGDDVPNPHCPFNSSLAPVPSNQHNILSLASRKKIVAPYAYVAIPPFSPSLVGTTYYAMGMGVSNNTGPYASEIDAAIAVRGPSSSYYSSPTASPTNSIYPDFIMYIGSFSCVNSANFLAVSDRTNGSVAFMVQAFEAHRAMATTNPNALQATKTDQTASFFTIPEDIFPAYTAESISAKVVEFLLAPANITTTTFTSTVNTVTSADTTTGSGTTFLTTSETGPTSFVSDSTETTNPLTATPSTETTNPLTTVTAGTSPQTSPVTLTSTSSMATSMISTTEPAASTSTSITTATSSVTDISTSLTVTNATTTSTTTFPARETIRFDTDLSQSMFTYTIRNAIPAGTAIQITCYNSTTNHSRMMCDVSFESSEIAEETMAKANSHELNGIYSASVVGPSTSTPDGDTNTNKTGLIVGVVIGIVAFVILMGAVLYYKKIKRASRDESLLDRNLEEINHNVTIFS